MDVAAAAAALARGEVVAFPTETYYGLAVDAFNQEAIDKLFALKGREAEKTLALIVLGPAMVGELCEDIPTLALRLMREHWPGPLTLALPARPGLPPALVNEGCVAMRESPHPVAAALVAALGRPITATSANKSGTLPARYASEVRAAFPVGVHVLDGGETPGGAPSTLARVRGESVEILRQGAVVL